MPTAEQDLTFLRAGVRDLSDYLLSKELYWPLEGGLPRLTIGGLLLAQRRIVARRPQQNPAAELDAIRMKWRVAWEQKGQGEYGARLELWRNYLQDYRDDPYGNAAAFPHEVQYRAMLSLLGREIPDVPIATGQLESLDAALKDYFLPDAFAWQADLAEAFPKPDFWFLYGRLRT